MQAIQTATSTATPQAIDPEVTKSFARVENLGEPVALDFTEALAAGQKFYFTGLPCKYGHIAERRTSDRSCMECRRIRDRQAEREKASGRHNPPVALNGRGSHLCGVPVFRGELADYLRTGKLPYKVVVHSGLMTPALDDDITAFYVREGSDRHGRLVFGIYRRDCGSQVASFLPGFPRAVGTIKDLFDAAFTNRRCFEKISDGQLRELYAGRDLFLPTEGMARDELSALEAA